MLVQGASYVCSWFFDNCILITYIIIKGKWDRLPETVLGLPVAICECTICSSSMSAVCYHWLAVAAAGPCFLCSCQAHASHRYYYGAQHLAELFLLHG